MRGRGEPCHVLDKAQDGNIDFVAGEHGYGFACVGECYLLRGRDDDSAGNSKGLHQCQVYVRCAGGHVDDKVVKVAPVGLFDQLFQGVRGQGAAPQDGRVTVDEKAYREQAHAEGFGRDNQIAAVGGFVHIYLGVFQSEHLGDRWSENIGVKESDTVSFACERYGEVSGDRRLADAAFARGHGDDVAYAGEHGGFFDGCLTDFGVDGDVAVFAAVEMYGGFGAFDKRAHEGVGGTVEYQRERHAVAVDADVIFDHA